MKRSGAVTFCTTLNYARNINGKLRNILNVYLISSVVVVISKIRNTIIFYY